MTHPFEILEITVLIDHATACDIGVVAPSMPVSALAQ